MERFGDGCLKIGFEEIHLLQHSLPFAFLCSATKVLSRNFPLEIARKNPVQVDFVEVPKVARLNPVIVIQGDRFSRELFDGDIGKLPLAGDHLRNRVTNRSNLESVETRR